MPPQCQRFDTFFEPLEPCLWGAATVSNCIEVLLQELTKVRLGWNL